MILSGCNESKIRTYTAPIQESQKANHHIFKSMSFTKLPDNWIIIQEQTMRQFTVLHAEKETRLFDLSISRFPGPMTSLEENVNRWRKQVHLQEQSPDTIAMNARTKSTANGISFISVFLQGSSQCIQAAIFDRKKETGFIKLMFDCNSEDRVLFDAFVDGLTYHD